MNSLFSILSKTETFDNISLFRLLQFKFRFPSKACGVFISFTEVPFFLGSV